MREKRVFAISTLQIIEKTIIFVARKTNKQMEAFYRTHAYLVEHINAPVRRDLMDEIDWSDRLIGIKGTRGVGKTTLSCELATYLALTSNGRNRYKVCIADFNIDFGDVKNSSRTIFGVFWFSVFLERLQNNKRWL